MYFYKVQAQAMNTLWKVCRVPPEECVINQVTFMCCLVLVSCELTCTGNMHRYCKLDTEAVMMATWCCVLGPRLAQLSDVNVVARADKLRAGLAMCAAVLCCTSTTRSMQCTLHTVSQGLARCK
jgi:hypothetical protein